MGSMKSRLILFSLMVLVISHTPQRGMAYENDQCVACHGLQSTKSRLRIDVEAFKRSVHMDNAECVDCHRQITDDNHSHHAGSGAVDCGECHDQENRHGRGAMEKNRPDCHDCHTRHSIAGKDDPSSSIHPDHLVDTCAQCHPAESGRLDALSWLPSIKIATHPKADMGGYYTEDNCVGCHQGQAAHGEKAKISEATCERCHMTDEGRNPMFGFIHSQADVVRQPGVFAAALLYLVGIVLLLAGGMFFFIQKISGS